MVAGAEMAATRHLLRFPATIAGLAGVAKALRALMDARDLADGPRYCVKLALEEIAANIVRHAAPAGDVTLNLEFGSDEVVLTFEDDGVPFDPLSRGSPALPSSLDDAIGADLASCWSAASRAALSTSGQPAAATG